MKLKSLDLNVKLERICLCKVGNLSKTEKRKTMWIDSCSPPDFLPLAQCQQRFSALLAILKAKVKIWFSCFLYWMSSDTEADGKCRK